MFFSSLSTYATTLYKMVYGRLCIFPKSLTNIQIQSQCHLTSVRATGNPHCILQFFVILSSSCTVFEQGADIYTMLFHVFSIFFHALGKKHYVPGEGGVFFTHFPTFFSPSHFSLSTFSLSTFHFFTFHFFTFHFFTFPLFHFPLFRLSLPFQVHQTTEIWIIDLNGFFKLPITVL